MDSQKSKEKRASKELTLWKIVKGISFLGLIIHAYLCYSKYNLRDKMVITKINDFAPFPAVTICSLNPYSRDLINSVDSVKYLMEAYTLLLKYNITEIISIDPSKNYSLNDVSNPRVKREEESPMNNKFAAKTSSDDLFISNLHILFHHRQIKTDCTYFANPGISNSTKITSFCPDWIVIDNSPFTFLTGFEDSLLAEIGEFASLCVSYSIPEDIESCTAFDDAWTTSAVCAINQFLELNSTQRDYALDAIEIFRSLNTNVSEDTFISACVSQINATFPRLSQCYQGDYYYGKKCPTTLDILKFYCYIQYNSNLGFNLYENGSLLNTKNTDVKWGRLKLELNLTKSVRDSACNLRSIDIEQVGIFLWSEGVEVVSKSLITYPLHQKCFFYTLHAYSGCILAMFNNFNMCDITIAANVMESDYFLVYIPDCIRKLSDPNSPANAECTQYFIHRLRDMVSWYRSNCSNEKVVETDSVLGPAPLLEYTVDWLFHHYQIEISCNESNKNLAIYCLGWLFGSSTDYFASNDTPHILFDTSQSKEGAFCILQSRSAIGSCKTSDRQMSRTFVCMNMKIQALQVHQPNINARIRSVIDSFAKDDNFAKKCRETVLLLRPDFMECDFLPEETACITLDRILEFLCHLAFPSNITIEQIFSFNDSALYPISEIPLPYFDNNEHILVNTECKTIDRFEIIQTQIQMKGFSDYEFVNERIYPIPPDVQDCYDVITAIDHCFLQILSDYEDLCDSRTIPYILNASRQNSLCYETAAVNSSCNHTKCVERVLLVYQRQNCVLTTNMFLSHIPITVLEPTLSLPSNASHQETTSPTNSFPLKISHENQPTVNASEIATSIFTTPMNIPLTSGNFLKSTEFDVGNNDYPDMNYKLGANGNGKFIAATTASIADATSNYGTTASVISDILVAQKSAVLPRVSHGAFKIISEIAQSMETYRTTDELEILFRERLREITSELKQIFNFSIRMNNFIQGCLIYGKPCNMTRDFKNFRSSDYGNCYTFNGNSDSNYGSALPGMNNGLELLLMENISDYLPTSSKQGSRITIHPQDIIPDVIGSGLNIQTGKSIQFELKYSISKYIEEPDNHCKLDEFMRVGSHKYNIDICLQQCENRIMKQNCQCFYSAYTNYIENPQLLACSSFNRSQARCLLNTLNTVRKRPKKYCDCPLECSSVNHAVSITNLGFLRDPSYQNPRLCSRSHLKFVGQTCAEFVRGNFALLNVYYSTLRNSVHEEHPLYNSSHLLSEISGAIGLWIGFSVVSVVSLLVKVIKIALKCCTDN